MFVGVRLSILIRFLSRKQFVKNNAETIDIARRRHASAGNLFRAGVLRCHYALERESLAAALRALRVQKFRNAEVEQLRFALGGDANVRWFDVAVNDQVLVRVSDG